MNVRKKKQSKKRQASKTRREKRRMIKAGDLMVHKLNKAKNTKLIMT